MKWFKDLNNIEDIKAKYKELCRKFHPDFSSHNRKKMTLEEIKERHGCQTIKTQKRALIA